MTNYIGITQIDVIRSEKKIETCEDKFRCLTDINTEKCECRQRMITYTFASRLDIQEAAEFYKEDACSKCVCQSLCKKTKYVMRFRGSSGRNGLWKNYMTIGNKNTYPLFRYVIWCPKYEKR